MLLLVLAVASAQPALPEPWAQFSRSGSLNHTTETVGIFTGKRTDGEFQYRLRLTKEMLGKEPETKWADSQTCPEVRSVISSMRDIEMPSPAPYGVGQPRSMTLDSTQYELTAPSSFNMGEVTLSSNVGSPLASWIDAGFAQLASCWKAAAS
jgi:hypothetical protein